MRADGLLEWMGRRRPTPPPELRRRLDDELRAADEQRPSADPTAPLVGAARARLDAAMARPGRVRETAFELLLADALVTYACEAALEKERPEEALQRILGVGRPS